MLSERLLQWLNEGCEYMRRSGLKPETMIENNEYNISCDGNTERYGFYEEKGQVFCLRSWDHGTFRTGVLYSKATEHWDYEHVDYYEWALLRFEKKVKDDYDIDIDDDKRFYIKK